MLNIKESRRDFVFALAGRAVSTFGDGVALVALTLRLQADGAQPYEIALLLGGGIVPKLLLARAIGVLVDTHDSRLLLVAAGLAEVAATIPLVFLHSVVPIVLLVALLGGAASLAGATWSALVPRVVGEEHVAEAVAAQQSLSVLVLVGAPAVGGLLAGAFGTGVPVAIDAGTFVVVTVAAALVRTRRLPDRELTAGPTRRVHGGFAILRADALLAPLLAGVALVVLLVGMADVVLVYLVRETLNAGGVWYGVVEASWMAGMVGGSLGAARVGTERGRVRATISGIVLVCAAVAGFAAVPDVWILVPLAMLGGAGNGYAGTCLSTLLVARTPDSARGRVSTAASAVLGGSEGSALLLGGVVAIVLSPRAIYAVAGLLGLGAAGILALTSSSGTSSRRGAGTPSMRVAGAEGLEPPTYGFGDRRSTN
jgi:MFS family permease